MNRKILKTLDKDLDSLKEEIYQQNTLKLCDDDKIILKAINEKFKDVVGLINLLTRNERELCRTTR